MQGGGGDAAWQHLPPGVPPPCNPENILAWTLFFSISRHSSDFHSRKETSSILLASTIKIIYNGCDQGTHNLNQWHLQPPILQKVDLFGSSTQTQPCFPSFEMSSNVFAVKFLSLQLIERWQLVSVNGSEQVPLLWIHSVLRERGNRVGVTRGHTKETPAMHGWSHSAKAVLPCRAYQCSTSRDRWSHKSGHWRICAWLPINGGRVTYDGHSAHWNPWPVCIAILIGE